jgi:hypothetical protein
MESISTIAQRGLPAVVEEVESQNLARAAREQFRVEMEHFAAAYRHELLDETIRVYWLALKKLPVEIRTQGLTRCLQAIKFFPTVAEILNACADVVDDRRKALAREAAKIQEDCDLRQAGICVSGMRETHEGMIRCECHKQGQALLARAHAPIERPALPEHTETT